MALAIWFSAVVVAAAIVAAGVVVNEGLELVAKAIKAKPKTAKGERRGSR